jgi:DNA-binding CsgD family transcriptional regulator
MPTNYAIDWDDLVEQHNRVFKTMYENHLEMIRDLHAEMTPEKIGERLGVHRTTVAYYLRKAGVQIGERKKKKYKVKTIASTIAKMTRDDLKGKTTMDLVEQFNIDPRYVRRIIRKNRMRLGTDYPYVNKQKKGKRHGKQR